ncbi:MAG: hypothetical protein LBH29_02350 [Elusimicrobiota bacterium]|jgi:hypothetical protein|nr:hypothetical protein [Elusimicrobiota bacterium]
MIKRAKEFCAPTHIIMFFISLLMFAIMLNYAGMKGFWFDEIGSLFWVSAPFMDMARATMSMREPVSFPFCRLYTDCVFV